MDTRAELIGTSTAIKELRRDVQLAAESDAKVLITGESGTGKEVVAYLIHTQSRRKTKPMVPINCAGITETLLESELFGHERGSFTGAIRDKAGLFEVAHGGTAFLDELGETSLRMQGTLLRFLETGEIQRVGSDRINNRVDVRVIAATNRNLLEQIAAGTFRLDLYYRLNVVHLRTPPLRERPEDVPLLLAHFLGIYSRRHQKPAPQISQDAMLLLSRYRWPGNVRELKNTAERLALRPQSVVQSEDLPQEVRAQLPTRVISAAPVPSFSHVDALYARIMAGDTFWSAVYEPFMSRDLTRTDVREVVRRGLGTTRGNYKLLVRLFNMPDADYKRLLNFLRKNECHLAFQPFRTIQADQRQTPTLPGAAA